jgi:hypothetical protein
MAITDSTWFRYYLGAPGPERPSSSGWQRYHRRHDVVRTAIERLNRDGLFTWTDLPGATEVFTDESELFQALQAHWHARFAGRLDTALETGESLRHDGLVAYRKTMDELPGLRRFFSRMSTPVCES